MGGGLGGPLGRRRPRLRTPKGLGRGLASPLEGSEALTTPPILQWARVVTTSGSVGAEGWRNHLGPGKALLRSQAGCIRLLPKPSTLNPCIRLVRTVSFTRSVGHKNWACTGAESWTTNYIYCNNWSLANSADPHFYYPVTPPRTHAHTHTRSSREGTRNPNPTKPKAVQT